jgi:hypothetical protein
VDEDNEIRIHEIRRLLADPGTFAEFAREVLPQVLNWLEELELRIADLEND